MGNYYHVPGIRSWCVVARMGDLPEEIQVNPLAALFIVLGVLLIIVGFNGSYHNVLESLKKL
jgi:hypothetical protein